MPLSMAASLSSPAAMPPSSSSQHSMSVLSSTRRHSGITIFFVLPWKPQLYDTKIAGFKTCRSGMCTWPAHRAVKLHLQNITTGRLQVKTTRFDTSVGSDARFADLAAVALDVAVALLDVVREAVAAVEAEGRERPAARTRDRVLN